MMTAFLLTLAIAAAPVTIDTTDGNSTSGSLVEMSADRVVVATQNGEVAIPVSDLLRLAPTSPTNFDQAPDPFEVQLVGGTQIQGTAFTVKERTATIVLESGEAIEVATRNIASVRFETSQRLNERWNQILTSDTAGDVIVIQRERDGEKSLDYIDDGVFGDVSAESVSFTFDDEVHDVTRENKVAGMIYYHASGRELPEAVCQITDIAGNHWRVKSCELTEGEVQFTTRSGDKGQLPLTSVKEFDFSAGKLQYLADLTPDSVQFTPYLGSNLLEDELARFYQPRFNKDFQGNDAPKNIAVRSRTRMVFTLPGEFGVFQAQAAIDPASTSGGVKLVISGDGETLYSEEINAGDEVHKIEFPVEGVERLSVFVDYGKNFQIQDQLNISKAMVKK